MVPLAVFLCAVLSFVAFGQGHPVAQKGELEVAAPIADKSIKLVDIVAARTGRNLEGFDPDQVAYLEGKEDFLQDSLNGANAGPKAQTKRQAPPAEAPPPFVNTDLSETELDEIEAARDAYRKRLQGSALAKALALSQAGPQEVSPDGSYAGKRRRRQVTNEAASQAELAEIEAARDAYRKRLQGSALAKALALSQAGPQEVSPDGSYAGKRRRRQVTNEAASQAELEEIERAREEYRKKLEGSGLAIALALAKAKPQEVSHDGSYTGR